MGRRKIPIEPIKEDRNRTVTFMKRKAGLFKKAHELAVLCQIHLALVVLTPEGRVFEYSTAENVAEVFEKRKAMGQVEVRKPGDFAGKYKESIHQGENGIMYENSDSNDEDSESPTISNDSKKKKGNSGGAIPSQSSRINVTNRPVLNKPRLKVKIPLANSRPGSPKKAMTPLNKLVPSTSSNTVGISASSGQSTQSDPASGSSKSDIDVKVNGGANGQPPNFSSPQVQHQYAPHPQYPQLMQFPFQQRINAQRSDINSPNGMYQGFAPIGYQGMYSPGMSVGYGYSPHPHGPQAGNVGQLPQTGQHPQAGSTTPGIDLKAPGTTKSVPGYQGAISQPFHKVNSSGQNSAGSPVTSNVTNSIMASNSMMSSAGGGRWSAYPQSPMTYLMPTQVDQNGNRSEPGPMTAAMSTRYMNEMMTSPSNYFSMEWGVWDPQASAIPGGTPRIVPPKSAHPQPDHSTQEALVTPQNVHESMAQRDSQSSDINSQVSQPFRTNELPPEELSKKRG